MTAVKLNIVESRCRCGIHQAGQEFLVEGTCPPICHELWQAIYPQVYTLKNGGELDCGESRARWFRTSCPGGRVLIFGECAVSPN